MNRRELIQSAIGAAGLGVTGAEIVVDEVAVKPEDEVVCFALRHQGCLHPDGVKNLQESVANIFHGTKWEGTKMFVLEEGMTFEAIKVRNVTELPQIGDTYIGYKRPGPRVESIEGEL